MNIESLRINNDEARQKSELTPPIRLKSPQRRASALYTSVHLYTCTLVHLCTGTLVHLYTCTLVHLYTGTLVHLYCTLVMCSGTLVQYTFIAG